MPEMVFIPVALVPQSPLLLRVFLRAVMGLAGVVLVVGYGSGFTSHRLSAATIEEAFEGPDVAWTIYELDA